jgi:acyl-homoserine-lactone acylase
MALLSRRLSRPDVRASRPRPVALLVLPALLALAACGRAAQPAPTLANEILWDGYGVPHIYAADHVSLFHGYGRAQAQAHGDLLLRLVGEARGRSAEYWGPAGLERDRWYWTYGVPQGGDRFYEEADPAMRRLVDAFAAGITAYAMEHPDRIDRESAVVLPVEGRDIYRIMGAIVSFFSPAVQVGRQWAEAPGSNAWAIAPSKSASGHAMLLANPHLPWSGNLTWFEAHLVAPGVDVHGASLLGLPVIAVGFNDRLGWTHTVSTVDIEDLYELALEGDGYRWDGGVRAFDADTVVLRVLEAALVRDDTLVVRRSVHGPVIADRGASALAVRAVAHWTGGRVLDQWWAMGRSRDLEQFRRALAMNQVIGFTTTYADADGNILHEYGGVSPVRPAGDYAFWARPVAGETSATLWTELHPLADMPRVLNPPAGWVQNTNEPVWWATFPTAVEPGDYPAYFAPLHMHFRAQQSVRLLDESGRLTLDDMIALKYSTRLELADRILPDLLAAARARGGAAADAATVLEAWDRSADAGSRGAVLFTEWVDHVFRMAGSAGVFARRFSVDEPRTTPTGLRDPALAAAALEAAAAAVAGRHGGLDVAWGDVHRLQRDDVDLPAIGASGGLGAFTVIGYRRGADGRATAVGGDSFIAAVEFGRPVRARTVLIYGNASQPGSPHRTDQMALFASKSLKPVWRTRAEVEADVRERSTF